MKLVVSGRLTPPGDKSITHRVLVLGAIANGTSQVEGALDSLDIQSMASVLRGLGVEVSDVNSRSVVIMGRGPGGLTSPSHDLNCGNSGTAARFVIGMLAGAGLQGRVVGDESLSRRPMRRVTLPLSQMGAGFTEEAGDGLPLRVHGGPLHELEYNSPNSSAQVKSALILAGLLGGVRVTVNENPGSRDHTERLLAHLGLNISVGLNRVAFEPGGDPQAICGRVAGDISSAAFMLGAAAIADESDLTVERVGVNPTRTGALEVLRRMGISIVRSNEREELGEPLADLTVAGSSLVATTIEAHEVPSMIDEIPLLAVVAARAEGTTVFEGVGELAVKESNRLQLLADNLANLGYSARADSDTLTIEGSDHRPAGRVETASDHRLAMAFAVLSRLPGAELEISELTSPAISYPQFQAHLDAVTRSV